MPKLLKTPETRGRGRPAADKPLSRTLCTRLEARFHEAFMARVKRERRRPSDLLRIMVEDALVAAGDVKPE